MPEEKQPMTEIRALLERKGKSQQEVADALGVTKQAVGKWVRGEAISLDNLRRLARYLDVSISELCGDEPAVYHKVDSFTEREQEGWTLVPVLDAYGGCASMGAFEQTGEVIGSVSFNDSFLQTLPGVVGSIQAERFCLVQAIGDSMVPTIGRYDHCLVDRAQTQVWCDGIYWLQIGGTYYIKRVAKNYNGSLTLLSDNTAYPPQPVPREDLDSAQVLGRVVRIISIRDI